MALAADRDTVKLMSTVVSGSSPSFTAAASATDTVGASSSSLIRAGAVERLRAAGERRVAWRGQAQDDRLVELVDRVAVHRDIHRLLGVAGGEAERAPVIAA